MSLLQLMLITPPSSEHPKLEIVGLVKRNHDIHKNIARIANAVPFTLNSRVTMNDNIVVLNCQKCNQCLTGHKSLG